MQALKGYIFLLVKIIAKSFKTVCALRDSYRAPFKNMHFLEGRKGVGGGGGGGEEKPLYKGP